MKLATIFGTRPEIIRLSQIIKRLDRLCDQTLIHTGQNYDPNLSDIFLQQLEVRQPDIHLGIRAAGFADQVGQIIARTAEVFTRSRPDKVLLLGDTNSGLAAIVAARMGIPVYHLEAGNRSYDDRVPEEINRRVIDHCSDVLMPYTQRSKENLLREGIERQRIFVVGNPIYEVIESYAAQIAASTVHADLDVAPGDYFLVTLHRAENVDEPARLAKLVESLNRIAATYHKPIVFSVHPRTEEKLARSDLRPSPDYVRMMKPLGFFDFVRLEQQALCVLSDSGTVQEECSIFRVPNVTVRDVTERPETIEAGSNIVTGVEPEDVLRAVEVVIDAGGFWDPPAEYIQRNVAATVAKVVASYHHVVARRR